METQVSRVFLVGGSSSSWSEFVNLLDAEGYAFELVPGAASPLDVVDRVQEADAVIIIDLAPDLMGGMEMVSACRRMAPSTPVVVVADNPSVKLACSLRESGVFYLGLHPIGVDELWAAVDDALRSVGRNVPNVSQVRTKKRVLIIDDDADFRAAVSALLESEEYVVSCATSAREGRERLGIETPDLVILDIVMEDAWAGYSMNQELKCGDLSKEAGEIPVLMVSSIRQSPEMTFPTAGEVGMVTPDAYMTKPLDIPLFLGNVRRLLSRKTARKR
ncbi:MAG: response regulator [Deltaproteobacteria bacterium]|nr:response regulator [Deltaproteobacteria bacterium]